MELHQVAREVRKSERVSRLNSDTSSSMDSEIKLEMHNFQDPQVSLFPEVFVIVTFIAFEIASKSLPFS
jgi:hypothetical protein